MVLSPSILIGVAGCFDASARSSVGCSRLSPLTMMRSAFASVCASDGAGSNVWEFVASGMSPWSLIRVPPTLRASELIGATVVATSSLSSSPVRVSVHPSEAAAAPCPGAADGLGDAEQPNASRPAARIAARRRNGQIVGLLQGRRMEVKR
jgi:hypothetical protein